MNGMIEIISKNTINILINLTCFYVFLAKFIIPNIFNKIEIEFNKLKDKLNESRLVENEQLENYINKVDKKLVKLSTVYNQVEKDNILIRKDFKKMGIVVQELKTDVEKIKVICKINNKCE